MVLKLLLAGSDSLLKLIAELSHYQLRRRLHCIECLVRIIRVHCVIVDAAAIFAEPKLLVPRPHVILKVTAVTFSRQKERLLVVLASRREEILEGDLALALLLDKGLTVLPLDTLIEPHSGFLPGLSVLLIAILGIHDALWAHWLGESKGSDHSVGLKTVVLG